MFVLFLGLMATVLTGCAATHTATTTPTGRQAANLESCASEAELPSEMAKPGAVILFGEIHGVKELPRFFGEAVCSTVKSGLSAAVGLEIPASEQERIDSFLDSAGQPSDVEEMLKGRFWSGEPQYGVASQARVDLLERLRRLRAARLRVRVFLFDIGAGENAAERDKTMALKIIEQAHSHSNELIMVLVGEIHAWKTKGTPWDENFLPMGWHLNDSGLRVYSLGRSTPKGTAWVCANSPVNCGTMESSAFQPIPSGRTSGIELLPKPSARGTDGLYAVSTLTASPPAARSHPVAQ